jgi:hypothetical protein
MKTTKTYILIAALLVLSNILFAQTVIKQYSGGKRGAVMNPAMTMGKDLSKHSSLKLLANASEKAFLYQNFVFSSKSEKGTKVTFVVQTDQKCEMKVLNMKMFTLLNENMNAADTLATEEIQIAKLNEAHNLYEFSFYTNKKFDTAGIMICGGGDFQTVKIYKVYVAAPSTASTSKSVSAQF